MNISNIHSITLPWLFTILYSLTVEAQNKRIVNHLREKNSLWFKGNVILNDQTELIGELSFDESTQTGSFKNNDEERNINPQGVLMFSFEDSRTQQIRTFLSIPYPADMGENKSLLSFDNRVFSHRNQKGHEVPTFFELLRECSNFVILSLKRPINFSKRTINNIQDDDRLSNEFDLTVRHVVQQNEIIFFMDLNEQMNPFIEFMEESSSSIEQTVKSARTRSEIIDSSVLQRFFGRYFEQVVEYSNTQKLQITKRDELLKIVDYYAKLSGMP
ncbi:MAG TPA: hypothetical protein DCE81_01635 [Cytophagales bacterium]|nr:hypothetical protein [Cytophagales bacterium]